jgi:hypothetical protein
MSNAETFSSLLNNQGMSQTAAAKAIAEITRRPIAPRTVRSWLTDPKNPSYRPCPTWAVDALKEYLRRSKVSDAKDQPSVKSRPKEERRRKPDEQSGFPYSFEELETAFNSAFYPPEKSKQKNNEHFRYRCRRCRMQVFGAPRLVIICGRCECVLDQMKS